MGLIEVKKRDGRIVDFDVYKIANAINKAMSETKNGIDEILSLRIANEIFFFVDMGVIDVEEIQNRVEYELDRYGLKDVAKQYSEYRKIRNRERGRVVEYKFFDDEFLSKYKHMPSPMSELGNFVYYRTYSRWLDDVGRREYWWETVARAVDYNCSLDENTTKEEARALYDNVFHLRQFLSGRTLWTGGTPVSKKFPLSNYNCAFQVIDEVECFHDLLYLLMIGAGVGVRVNKEDVAKLPKFRNDYELICRYYIPTPVEEREEHTTVVVENACAKIIVGDSKSGWSETIKYYFQLLVEKKYEHINTIMFVFNHVRPKGEKLKTFGGTASGHIALQNMIEKINRIFQNKSEKRFNLLPIDCLDICNIIGEGVVVGGVRRTAEIALFDSDDEDCINAKANLYKELNGEWKVNEDIIHRQMSNNSIYYKKKPTREELHWLLEKQRYSGEPGFVNEEAALKRRENFKGVNPCAEILLDSKGTCNLTTVNVMAFVENGVLKENALLHAQALSARAGYRMTLVELELPKWNKIQQRDKLLGCSLTGWQDMVNATKMTKEQQKDLLTELWTVAQLFSFSYADELGQEMPLLVTTLKPEGTLSQLPVVSSGIHYSHSPYYIRRIRVSSSDPIVKVCKELEYPMSPEVGQTWENATTLVVEFPVASPEGKTKYDVSAIEQLENYKMFMKYYIDHNCSITVHVRDDEWEDVEEWMWDNWDDVVAVSFLSLDDSFYELLPYEAITKEEYEEMKSNMRPFIPSLISKYESEEIETEILDNECSSGACPIR